MNARMSISLFVAPLLACSDGSVPGTPYPLPAHELAKAEHAAANGESWGDKELAFHYDFAGDRQRSEMHFARCLKAQHPECLAEKANHLIAAARDPNTSESDRNKLLDEALRFNTEAIASDKRQSNSYEEGLLAQRRAITDFLNGKNTEALKR
ncbi:MAG: hypothetical protein AAFR88_02125 [Pseudomonadota bacterium]